MAKPKPQSAFLRRAIKGLTLSAPYALATHFEDSYAHCVEASVCGAAALQRLKIRARAIPCALVGYHEGRATRLCVGLNAYDIYERQSVAEVPRPTFEEWAAGQLAGLPTDDLPIHMMIEASFGGERALVDLTLGQLRQNHGVKCTAHMSWFGDGWPTWDTPDGWVLWYEDTPHASKVLDAMRAYSGTGLTGDIANLLEAVLRCDNDFDRFTLAMEMSQPAMYAMATSRLNRMFGFGQEPE